MDKRYQVFISSTYTDLKDERRAVYQTLMEMDCIPAGMELFPATDEEQWLFIQKIIDDSDYYVLILGGRYGSVTADGVSYTEKEFDYAISKGVKVVALIHGEPGKLPVEKSEMDPAVREKLEAFRNKAADGRLVKFWTGADQIPGLVATSLLKTMKMFPAVGWVRADKATGSAELLAQINELRIANDKLKEELEAVKTADVVFPDNIASGRDSFFINFIEYRKHKETYYENTYWDTSVRRTRIKITEHKGSCNLTWDEIFSMLSPKLCVSIASYELHLVANNKLKQITNAQGDLSIIDDDFVRITNQLRTLDLIVDCELMDQKNKPVLAWKLTDKGRMYSSKLLVVRKPPTDAAEPHAALQDQS